MNAPKQIVIDWSRVQQYDLRRLLISIPLFIAYGLVLVTICAFGANVVTGIFFVGIQIGIGLSASRYAYTAGRSSKSNLSLQDPSQLDTSWDLILKETHNSDVKRIFEKFHKSIREADRKTIDDLNDISWFIVIIWAMVSGLAFLSSEIVFPICLSSSGILGVACLLTYYNGHQGIVNGYFEDDIDHLEYYVQSRLAKIGKLDGDVIQRVIWKTKNNKMVLYDFVATLYEKNNISLQYFLGIPSKEKERFLLSAEKSTIDKIVTNIDEESFKDWDITRNSDAELCISSKRMNLDLMKKESFIQFPEEPVYIIKSSTTLLEIVKSNID